MLYIYLGIVLFLMIFVVWNMVKTNDLLLQVDAALILVPLLLRLLLIK